MASVHDDANDATPMAVGFIQLDVAFVPEAMAAHLAAHLKRAGATAVQLDADRVRFWVPDDLRWSSSVLFPWDSGELAVDAGLQQVRYRVDAARLCKLVGIVVGGLAVVMLAVIGFKPSLLCFVVPVFLGVAWLGITGFNVAVGLFRLRRFLRRAVAAALREGAARGG